ncbi:MAG: YqcC family protein [Cellvibrionales bacterium]|nr:YqcC family protein [Cellvibrionales bacterium]
MSQKVSQLLDKLEQVLRAQDLWTVESPSEEALMSQEPFAVDQMDFNEWLQWLFIPRVKMLIEEQIPLPKGANLSAMGEVFCQVKCISTNDLLVCLNQIDEAMNGH